MNRTVLFLLLFALSDSLWAQQSKGDLYYSQAKEFLDKGEQEKSIKTFKSSRSEYLKELNYYRYFVATQALSIIYQDTGEGTLAESIIGETIVNIPQKSADQFELHAKLQDNLAYTYLYVTNKPEDAVKAYSSAIAFYEKAGKANTPSLAFELVNRAICLQSLSQFEASNADIIKAIQIYESDSQTGELDLAGYYLIMGENYSSLEIFDKALASLQKGLSLAGTEEGKEFQAKFFNSIGNVYSAQARFKTALEFYQKAKAINEELFGKDASNYSQNVINAGNALKDLGDWEGALAAYQEVLTIYEQTPPDDLSNVTSLIINMSRITDDLGKFDLSQQLIAQALNFTTTFIGKNSIEEADVYVAMGSTAYNHAAYDECLNFNMKALSILQANNYPVNSYQGMIYGNIGQAYDELNDITLAVKYKNQAVDLYTRVYGVEHSSTGMAIGNLAHSFEVAREYDKALEYLYKSLAIIQKTLPADHDNIAVTYMDIGLMLMYKDDYRQGMVYLKKAQVILDKHSKNLNKAKLYNRLAEAYSKQNDLSNAEKCIAISIASNTYDFDDKTVGAVPAASNYISHYELAVSFIAKADLFRRRGDVASLESGLKQLDATDVLLRQKAVDLSNAKDRLELSQLNAFFSEAGFRLCDALYAKTKQQRYIEKAFMFSERSKANELLSDIRLGRASSLSRMPKNLLQKSASLSANINALQQQIASAHSAQDLTLITKLKAKEFDLTNEYKQIQEQMMAASPRFKALAGQRAVTSWTDVQKILDAESAMVSYSITDSAKFILIGNRQKLVMKRIDPKTDLNRLIRGYTNQIKFQADGLESMRETLTEILWAPVEDAFKEIGVPKSIILIPDGALTVLPFESLGKGEYLLAKYTMRNHLSAALLVNEGAPSAKLKPSFIALAPVFADKETNFVNKSCQRFAEQSKKADSTSRAFSTKGDYISPLPGTRTEVEKIDEIHNGKGHDSKIFLEQDAREEVIKSGALAEFGYIHFATHGFVNSQYPELSGLLLTQDAKSSEDGVLYTGEILGLTLHAELVTLSACETALGKSIEGEGLRGLSTAFLFAGAKNVVASLWKVADESTAVLMVDFYSQLVLGKDKANALRSAKLNLIKDPRFNHPYYWSPFIQIGAN